MYGLVHAGGENTIELKSNKRLGEVSKKENLFFLISIF
jgi:hypothetical protein